MDPLTIQRLTVIAILTVAAYQYFRFHWPLRAKMNTADWWVRGGLWWLIIAVDWATISTLLGIDASWRLWLFAICGTSISLGFRELRRVEKRRPRP